MLDDQTRDAVRARAQRAADQTRDHRLRLARLASVKHGRPGFNWTTTYNYAWAKRLGVAWLEGTVRYGTAHATR